MNSVSFGNQMYNFNSSMLDKQISLSVPPDKIVGFSKEEILKEVQLRSKIMELVRSIEAFTGNVMIGPTNYENINTQEIKRLFGC